MYPSRHQPAPAISRSSTSENEASDDNPVQDFDRGVASLWAWPGKAGLASPTYAA